MKNAWGLVVAMLLVLPPWTAWGTVIPISDVNADTPDGYPVLLDDVVTVAGVVTVGTGALADSNDIYIEDTTGGLNVRQGPGASPIVASGDSVRVTGKVAITYGDRTYLQIDAVIVPGSRIEMLGSGNPLPAPVVLTPRALAGATGEAYEGIYAVVKNVTLPYPSQWPSTPCTQDAATYIADGDTMCRLWFDADAHICGSPLPLERFDVYGVVIPRPRTVAAWRGHGMLPPERSWIRSRGSGSGFATIEPGRVYVDQTVALTFTVSGEADTLTRITLAIPEGWGFSGSPHDVALAGGAFAGATVVADSTAAHVVTIAGAGIVYGVSGTITVSGLETPSEAGASTFGVATAVPGGALLSIESEPSVATGSLAAPRSILLNEVYAFSNDAIDDRDRAEFVELVNPGPDTVDISGWVLTDLDDSGVCGGTNLWEFPFVPRTVMAPGEYVVVVKDAWQRPYTRGFLPVFADSVDLGTLKIFEMVDTDYSDSDWTGDGTWPNVPNMTLVTPVDGNPATSQEIRLLGGPDGNGALVANVPAADAVYLYTDLSKAVLVDAMEYRDPVFLAHDYCSGVGAGGPDDAYVPGPPPSHYSLGRDTHTSDTGSTAADFSLSSWPTPGAQNVPKDTRAPVVKRTEAVASEFVVVEWSEALDAGEATDLAHYSFSGGLDIRDAWLSRDERTVLLQTALQTPDALYLLSIAGVTDLVGNEMEPDTESALGYYEADTPIGDIQAYDETGYSPFWGQNATVIGFTTVPPGIFQPDRTNMFIQNLDGSGINIYARSLMPYPAVEGDLIKTTGLVLEYRSVDTNDPWAIPPGSTTEISNAVISILARGFNVIEPEVVPSGEVGVEEKEGTLVETSGVVVSVEGFSFYIDDGSGACQIYQNFTGLDFSKYAVGDSVRATGVVLQYDYTPPYFGGYELAPRYESDLVKLAGHYTADARVSTSARVLDLSEENAIEISYNAPSVSHVAIRIFDLKGRPIATLYDGLCLGPSRASWDGRDDGGKKVPPGVYICHVQARERSGAQVSDAAVPIVVGMKLE
jgi:hypothetical protein